jgi:hypothetical protein
MPSLLGSDSISVVRPDAAAFTDASSDHRAEVEAGVRDVGDRHPSEIIGHYDSGVGGVVATFTE